MHRPGLSQPRARSQFRSTVAFGVAQIKIRNDDTLEFKTQIVNQAGETFFAGHVHAAPAGANGPIVVPLFAGPPTSEMHIGLSGEMPIAASLAAAICGNPAGYYVNYHTTANPGGAIRGQLG
jgi:hypothetical protein